jgi:hypothetical protein
MNCFYHIHAAVLLSLLHSIGESVMPASPENYAGDINRSPCLQLSLFSSNNRKTVFIFPLSV